MHPEKRLPLFRLSSRRWSNIWTRCLPLSFRSTEASDNPPLVAYLLLENRSREGTGMRSLISEGCAYGIRTTDGLHFDVERTQPSGERSAGGARPMCHLILKPLRTWNGITPGDGFLPDGSTEKLAAKRAITRACGRLAKTNIWS
jgi:hypothetical protein